MKKKADNIIKFTHVSLDPSGDGYDAYFCNDKLLMEGDYYHDQINDKFRGVLEYLNFIKQEYKLERIDIDPAELNEDSNLSFDYIRYQVDNKETASEYAKRVEKELREWVNKY